MTDDYTELPPLDLTSPVARVAIREALRLVAAARGSSTGGAEAWANYILEVDRVVKFTLDDPSEVVAGRLAWTIHGLAMVARYSTDVAAETSTLGPLDVDLLIQRKIDEAGESASSA